MNTFKDYTNNLVDIMSVDGPGFIYFRMFVESCIANERPNDVKFLDALHLVNQIAGLAQNGFDFTSTW